MIIAGISLIVLIVGSIWFMISYKSHDVDKELTENNIVRMKDRYRK